LKAILSELKAEIDSVNAQRKNEQVVYLYSIITAKIILGNCWTEIKNIGVTMVQFSIQEFGD
jgi:hypothetical protein